MIYKGSVLQWFFGLIFSYINCWPLSMRSPFLFLSIRFFTKLNCSRAYSYKSFSILQIFEFFISLIVSSLGSIFWFVFRKWAFLPTKNHNNITIIIFYSIKHYIRRLFQDRKYEFNSRSSTEDNKLKNVWQEVILLDLKCWEAPLKNVGRVDSRTAINSESCSVTPTKR